jgi:dinuclear metal center YbgI/SA1388 family protein
MDRDQLVAYLDEELSADEVQDVATNGMQVAGASEITRIATGVSASVALFEAAVGWGADAVLVHHGLFWRSDEPTRLVGSMRTRVRLLLEHDLSLIAYHLPLDRHPIHGNSAVMARKLGLEQIEAFGSWGGIALGCAGVLPTPLRTDELLERLHRCCAREPLHFPGGPAQIASIGIVSGGAPNGFEEAVSAGLDCYITGEAREWVMQRAIEDGVHFIAAGHYATERFGVLALGRWLEQQHGLEVEFVDLPNPV